MKVYLIVDVEEEDHQIHAVFIDKEMAVRMRPKFDDAGCATKIIEMDTDAYNQYDTDELAYWVSIDRIPEFNCVRQMPLDEYDARKGYCRDLFWCEVLAKNKEEAQEKAEYIKENYIEER